MNNLGVSCTDGVNVSEKKVEKFYERMVLIRHFEYLVESLFKSGLLRGTVHCCIGQEATAVGVISALTPSDIMTGTHRSHGHFLAYKDDTEGLLAEISGRPWGLVGGRGGTQHLHAGNFYSNGVQGSMVPLATGMAYAEKLKGARSIAVCFIGDGTLGQGILYESMNMASLWRIPVLYLVENNYYAMSTSVAQAVAGSMTGRATAFGIECAELTSNDVEVVFEKAKEVVTYIREKQRPFFWVINTYRFCGHSKGDDRSYRSKEEEERWKMQDPLLIVHDRIGADLRESVMRNVKSRLEQAAFKIFGETLPIPISPSLVS